MNGRCRITDVVCAPKGKGLSARNRNGCIEHVAIPEQGSSTGKEPANQVLVDLEIDGSQAHFSGVVGAVIVKVGVVAVKVEASSQRRAMRKRFCNLGRQSPTKKWRTKHRAWDEIRSSPERM